MLSIGTYAEYQAETDELNKAERLVLDASTVINSITGNFRNPGALTFDSFVRGITASPYNYPAQQVRDMLNMAWPFIPQKYRDRLSKREVPSAPPPTLPPANAPIRSGPNKGFPQSEYGMSKTTKALLWTGGGITVAYIGYRLFFARRRA